MLKLPNLVALNNELIENNICIHHFTCLKCIFRYFIYEVRKCWFFPNCSAANITLVKKSPGNETIKSYGNQGHNYYSIKWYNTVWYLQSDFPSCWKKNTIILISGFQTILDSFFCKACQFLLLFNHS